MIEFLDSYLTLFAAILIAILMVPLTLAAIRMVTGPGYADRFVALDMLTGIAVAIAALTMIGTGRREFLDIAFGIALIGFLATCSLSALLEKKKEDK
ncbi:monovalent cation/H+ antiporter complex subunit F [Pannonibacter sp. Q-1]|uniref:Cation transporter n=2 Tax=Pannonibacter TaxID=227873 RepID=A0A0L0J0E1_9HYPH|nr:MULTISPECIES: monovalent cation/H+ antiporter complex subunit F [Pannonibacter]ALV27705.1 cation transporter [Pannonibacter phragmitetus]KND19058.1 cation transporter [Pannonibacter phragmitetus]MBA4204771.1 K+/H+ antiporter subunit F [Polymorphum sp.]CUA92499.1 Multisubunit Na+/H+ antiporter, MnhF subunit [Pannonibacter indicus]